MSRITEITITDFEFEAKNLSRQGSVVQASECSLGQTVRRSGTQSHRSTGVSPRIAGLPS